MNNKNGSIKAIVIILIAVIVLAAVGFVVYKTEISKVPLYSVVKVGDYIKYDAGKWTANEIASLTSNNLYAPEGNVTIETPYQFGGFKEGYSRNDGIVFNGASKEAKNGWRVLSVDNTTGVVTIISNGITEAFYYPGEEYGGYVAEEVLNVPETVSYRADNVVPRDWSMYLNTKLATKAICITKSNIDELTKNIVGFNDVIYAHDVINNETNYWLGTAFGQSLLYAINTEGLVTGGNNKVYGIRVIIELKPTIKVNPLNDGNGSEPLPWKI